MFKEKASKIYTFAQKITQFKNYLISLDYKKLYEDSLDQVQALFKDVKFKLNDLKSTNYELALFHYHNGNIADARFRFWLYSKFWPGKPEVDYFLGRINFELKKFGKAKEYLLRYKGSQQPAYQQECEYTLKVIENQLAGIKEIPLSLIKHKYDCTAVEYHQHLLDNINSTAQMKLCAALEGYLNEIARPYGNRLLDLGSGTGFIGRLLRENKAIGFATGVDISNEACKLAAAQKIDGNFVYNQVLNISINDFFSLSKNHDYDLVMLGGILNYFSNSEDLIGKVTQVCKKGTVLCVLFNAISQAKESNFSQTSEEFLHNPKKVRALLERYGWQINREENLELVAGMQGKFFICKL